jgi:hypothetical protein
MSDSVYIPLTDFPPKIKKPPTPQELLEQSYQDLERLEEIKKNIFNNISILEEQITLGHGSGSGPVNK